MASRQLSDLTPAMQAKAEALLQYAAELNVEILIYCTYRPLEEQARLYRQGRTLGQIKRKALELREAFGRPDLAEILMGVGPQTGRHIVTHAGPGQSLHNYRLALDGVPICDGKPVWSDRSDDDLLLWNIYGEAGRAAGLEWAGNWGSFKELPHQQDADADWRKLI